MKFVELLEKDKQNLLTELAASKEAEKAAHVLENELDKLLLMYNEQCSNERERNAAAYMTQAIRFSLPLIDSAGDTKVWERESSDSSGSSGKGWTNPLVFLFLIGALILCGLGLFPLLAPSFGGGIEGVRNFDAALLKPIGFILSGIASALVAGFLARRPARKPPRRSQLVEIRVDSSKVYRSFRNALLAVDRNLEEIRSMERWDKRSEAGRIDGREVTDSELDVFSDLLAASYSNDPDFALEKIEEIKYYLHRQQIEVVDYSEDTAQFFDTMPGQQAGTIRPAMVANGTLLRKGMASSGMR